jgi:hypothetical protein
MQSTRRNVLLLALAALATTVATIDAVTGRDWDLTALLAAAVALQVAAIAGVLGRRRSIELRPDLASWLREQAAATGEPAERVADRALAAYRAGLTGDSPAAGPREGR